MALSTRQRRPTWEMLDVLPYQGEWTVDEYLKLATNKPIEYTNGFLEFLPMPDEIHWQIQEFLFALVREFLTRRGRGVAHYAPFKVRIGAEKFREPDICVLLDDSDPRRARKYWGGADAVFEVVSPDDPARDYIEKRVDYATAGVLEYWIVDPSRGQVLVLRLNAGQYTEDGPHGSGSSVASHVLPGFSMNVDECFAVLGRVSPRDVPPAQ